MSLNKDGLEPGQSVDFVTLKRIQRQHDEAKKDAEQQKTRRKKVRTSDESGIQNASPAEAQKEA